MLGIKLALLIAILVAGTAGAAFPLVRRGAPANEQLLGWGNAFAAGVFLAAGLVHMMPEALESWAALGYDAPIPFALAALAFALMLLVEHVLVPEQTHEEVHAPSGERFARVAERGLHEHHAIGQDALSAYVVLTALSIHSLLAGLALGAEAELEEAIVISLAIIAHKTAAGFALGVSLARSALEKRVAWMLVAIFALATPFGGLVGMALGASVGSTVGATLEAAFLAIAGGTFVYVATFDILRDELSTPDGRFAKWVVLTTGLVGMSVLAIWI